MNKDNSPQTIHPVSHFRIRKPRLTRRAAALLIVVLLTLVMTSVALAEIQLPAPGNNAFIQTSGNQAGLGIGDFRTSVNGDNLPHVMNIIIPCIPNETYNFDLFDPSIEDIAGIAIDEPRPDPPDTPQEDNALFRLERPDGTQIVPATGTWQIFAPNSFHDTWVNFYTLNLPANPVAGVDCGTFTLETRTGDGTGGFAANDDDNAWIFALRGNDQNGANTAGGELFDPLVGPDGVQGTGDEAFIGETAISFQHAISGCQDFYWVVDDGQTNLFMTNFDMDLSRTATVELVCYYPPGYTGASCVLGQAAFPAGVVEGTPSDITVWNDSAPQGVARPNYSDMDTFDPTIPDLVGDAITSPASGVWRATLCVEDDNQYSFEVCDASASPTGCTRQVIFLEEPLLPNLIIDKDDGVVQVTSPGQTTYTLTITNTGQGAAMPLAGPEIVDQLPPGTTFNSCTVNAPLVGTCTHVGGGTINIDLQAQSATVPAFLPGTAAAPDNVGTITVVANIDAGLAAGTSLNNVATLDYTDLLGTNYPQVSDDDTDTVIGAVPYADLSLDKSLDSVTGNTAQFSVSVTNSGPDTAFDVEVTDRLPAGFTNFTFVSATQGTYDTGTNVWSVGDLIIGQTETLTYTVDFDPADLPLTNIAEVTQSLDGPGGAPLVDPDSVPDNGVPTEDDQDTVTIGGTPPPGPGGSGGGSGSRTEPPLIFVDPAITKLGDPMNAIVGETIVFRVTVSNPTDQDITNIVITDNVPSIFDVISATTTQGTVSHQGNTYFANIGTLAPGASAVLTITTVANAAASPPETCNVAVVGSVGSNEVCPNIFPGALPATGGQPLNPAIVAGSLLALIGAIAAAFLVRRQPAA